MQKLRIFLLSISGFIILIGIFLKLQEPLDEKPNRKTENQLQDPTSIKMYISIEKWSKIYAIPRKLAYGIAYYESRYRGPLDWNYNHALTSSVGAVGPMQIRPSTSKFITGKSITANILRQDIDLNIKTSMQLLRYLKNRYGTWERAIGFYATGRPEPNFYSRKVLAFKPTW
jgi:soluble lytic murein transglycosylase-like protein